MKDEIVLKFNSYWTDGSKLFFSAIEFNGLFCMDLKDNSVEYVKFFDKDDFRVTYLHYAPAIRYNDSLIFLPYRKNHISVVDCNTYEERTVLIKEDAKGCAIIDSVVKENLAWLFSMYGEVFIFDLEKEKIVKQIKIKHPFGENNVWWHVCEEKQVAWGIIMYTNYIIKFDLLNEVYEIINIPDDNISLVRLTAGNESLYFALEDGADIVEWNIKKNTVHRHSMYNKNGKIDRKSARYRSLLFLEEKGIIVIPDLQDKAIYFFDINSKKVKTIEDFSEEVLFEEGSEKFYFSLAVGIADEIWFLPEYKNSQLLRYNVHTDKMHANKIAINRTNICGGKNGFARIFKENTMNYEDNKWYSLENFIEII